MSSHRLRLPHDASAPAAARALVRAAAEGLACADDAELVISELVTNAVRHGAGEIDVRVDVAGRVRIEIRHPASGTRPVLLGPEPGRTGGNGLLLVSRLADDWGWHEDGGVLMTWAELGSGR